MMKQMWPMTGGNPLAIIQQMTLRTAGYRQSERMINKRDKHDNQQEIVKWSNTHNN